ELPAAVAEAERGRLLRRGRARRVDLPVAEELADRLARAAPHAAGEARLEDSVLEVAGMRAVEGALERRGDVVLPARREVALVDVVRPADHAAEPALEEVAVLRPDAI